MPSETEIDVLERLTVNRLGTLADPKLKEALVVKFILQARNSLRQKFGYDYSEAQVTAEIRPRIETICGLHSLDTSFADKHFPRERRKESGERKVVKSVIVPGPRKAARTPLESGPCLSLQGIQTLHSLVKREMLAKNEQVRSEIRSIIVSKVKSLLESNPDIFENALRENTTQFRDLFTCLCWRYPEIAKLFAGNFRNKRDAG